MAPKITSRDMAIAFRGFHKVFGETVAVDALDLDVPRGEIMALLGPNASGKTTSIRAICGMVVPTAGTVEMFGQDAWRRRHALRPLLGYMPQAPALYEDLTAIENIDFHAVAHGTRKPYDRAREVTELIGLGDRASDPVHTFSGGMKQRVSLACALVHDPPILLLDEPTAGLDPALRRTFWAHFQELRDRGRTLLISTHQLDEALFCDTLAILRLGRLLAVDEPQRVLRRGKTHVEIDARGRTERRTVADYEHALPRVLEEFGLSDEVDSLRVEHDTLDDVFLQLTAEAEDGSREAEALRPGAHGGAWRKERGGDC